MFVVGPTSAIEAREFQWLNHRIDIDPFRRCHDPSFGER